MNCGLPGKDLRGFSKKGGSPGGVVSQEMVRRPKLSRGRGKIHLQGPHNSVGGRAFRKPGGEVVRQTAIPTDRDRATKNKQKGGGRKEKRSLW